MAVAVWSHAAAETVPVEASASMVAATVAVVAAVSAGAWIAVATAIPAAVAVAANKHAS